MLVFHLDSSKLNEILYNMENQTKDSVIVITTGEILSADDATELDSSNTYPLPQWGPVDGFRIMNEFVSQLKNPVVKEELKAVLNSGHGVFRKYKNCLKGSPEIEKIWYSFKKDQIKTKVLNWYNQIREYAGLEMYEDDNLNEEEDLLDFDFTLNRPGVDKKELILEWDRAGFDELYSNYPKGVRKEIYKQKRAGLIDDSMFDSDIIYTAVNPSGDMVGFVWVTVFTLEESFSGMDLIQLYVIPEYRGLGIGKMLLNVILEEYNKGEYKDLIINCQGDNSWLMTYLELEGFTLAFQELSFRK